MTTEAIKPEVWWERGAFVAAYHIAALIGLPLFFIYRGTNWIVWVGALIIYLFTGVAITAGYHRLYSHASYKAHPLFHYVILFWSSIAVAGSAIGWSYNHRLHHRYVDTEKDPYNIKKGFWYAHFWWLFTKTPDIDQKVVKDLWANPILRFQHKYHIYLSLINNALMVFIVGYLSGGDYLGAFFIAFLLRLLVVHHIMFFVNSLAHTWGDQPFSKKHTAVDNWLISLFTFGEGYHNYHHSFANDYRNGIKWYNYDPSKWLVWTSQKVGLTWSLKKVDWETATRKWVEENKSHTMEAIKKNMYVKREILNQKVDELAESITKNLITFRMKKKEYEKRYEEFKKDRAKKKQLKLEIKQLRKSIKKDCKSWYVMCKTIARMQPQI